MLAYAVKSKPSTKAKLLLLDVLVVYVVKHF